MFRSILTVCLIVLLVGGCWIIYKRINGDNGLGSGNVYVSTPGTSKDDLASGNTTDDQSLEQAHPTPSRSDEPGTINTEPISEYGGSTGTTAATPAPPLTPLTAQPAPRTQQPYPAQNYGQVTQVPQYAAQPYGSTQAVPAADTFAPNPPNGLAYAGTGAYEVYRQGDLTYRLNTSTGVSCVLYATMEQWTKPIVYSHGCGGRGARKTRR